MMIDRGLPLGLQNDCIEPFGRQASQGFADRGAAQALLPAELRLDPDLGEIRHENWAVKNHSQRFVLDFFPQRGMRAPAPIFRSAFHQRTP
jgi:hypothetical protein